MADDLGCAECDGRRQETPPGAAPANEGVGTEITADHIDWVHKASITRQSRLKGVGLLMGWVKESDLNETNAECTIWLTTSTEEMQFRQEILTQRVSFESYLGSSLSYKLKH